MRTSSKIIYSNYTVIITHFSVNYNPLTENSVRKNLPHKFYTEDFTFIYFSQHCAISSAAFSVPRTLLSITRS